MCRLFRNTVRPSFLDSVHRSKQDSMKLPKLPHHQNHRDFSDVITVPKSLCREVEGEEKETTTLETLNGERC